MVIVAAAAVKTALVEQILVQGGQFCAVVSDLWKGSRNFPRQTLHLPIVRVGVELLMVELGNQERGTKQIDVFRFALRELLQLEEYALVLSGVSELSEMRSFMT